jgi:hypothetical protein
MTYRMSHLRLPSVTRLLPSRYVSQPEAATEVACKYRCVNACEPPRESLPLTGERTVPGIPTENYWLVST